LPTPSKPQGTSAQTQGTAVAPIPKKQRKSQSVFRSVLAASIQATALQSKPGALDTMLAAGGAATLGNGGDPLEAFLRRRRSSQNARARGAQGLARWLLSTNLRPSDYLEQVRDALELRPRLLVAAPSNAAVDNLVERVARHGAMLDGTLRPFAPPIARVGSGVGPAVEQLGVSLEAQLQGYLRLDAPTAEAGLQHAKRGMAAAAAELERIRR